MLYSYAISQLQEHAVQLPFLRGALRPPNPPRFSTQLGKVLFLSGALAGCLASMEDMMYRLVQKSSVYSISELHEHAVQVVFFSSLHLLFIHKVSKKGGRRMSRRMASKDPPSSLDTARQTENFTTSILSYSSFSYSSTFLKKSRYGRFWSFAFALEPLSLSLPGPRAFRRAAKKAPWKTLETGKKSASFPTSLFTQF